MAAKRLGSTCGSRFNSSSAALKRAAAEAARLVARVIVQAPPLVHDEHAGPLARCGVIPGDEPLEDGAALAVLDFFGLNPGRVGRWGCQREPRYNQRQSVLQGH